EFEPGEPAAAAFILLDGEALLLSAFNGVLGGADEAALHTEEGFENGSGVVQGETYAHGPQQGQQQDGTLPALWIQLLLGDYVENRKRTEGSHDQGEIEQHHLPDAHVEAHDHDGQHEGGDYHHQRIRDVGGQVHDRFGFHAEGEFGAQDSG